MIFTPPIENDPPGIQTIPGGADGTSCIGILFWISRELRKALKIMAAIITLSLFNIYDTDVYKKDIYLASVLPFKWHTHTIFLYAHYFDNYPDGQDRPNY